MPLGRMTKRANRAQVRWPATNPSDVGQRIDIVKKQRHHVESNPPYSWLAYEMLRRRKSFVNYRGNRVNCWRKCYNTLDLNIWRGQSSRRTLGEVQ